MPYGYVAENKKLLPHSQETSRPQYIFERFAERPSLSRLRDELHRRGWYTRAEKPWGKMALDHILRNPIYCGLIHFGKQQFKGIHEALIEESLYRRVQSVRRDRSHGATKLKPEFLLKWLIRCAECGSAMTPHYTQKRYQNGSVIRIPYYRCTKSMQLNNAACPIKHINADHLESLVVGKLSELSQNEAYLKISVAEMNGDLKRKVGPLQKETQHLRNRLKEIEQETGRYVKALGQGRLAIGRLETEIASLESDRDSLQTQLDEFERKINETSIRDFNAKLLFRTLRDFRTAFPSLTPPEQAEALQCVLKGVTIHPQKLALEIFELEEFHPSSQNRKNWLPGLDSN